MTRYEFFRKRIAPALFLGVVGLIAYDTCDKQERRHASIVFELGDAEPRVKAIVADLVVENEIIGHFERNALPDLRIGCPCRFETAMPADSGELRIDVDLGGEHRKLTKKIRPIEGGKVTLQLGPDLK
jgi:hypothetical protein